MNLLHPWFLLGFAAVSLPLAVHFLTRPRPRVLPLSTIRFVREAVQQRRARHRLRDWIVLLLRTAAVALIALAFARPLIGAKHAIATDPANTVRVVILDQSQSMAAVSNGIQAFERARTTASAHLVYAPGLQADLILAGAKARPVFPAGSSNFGAMREALASAVPRPEGLNLKAAIDAAGEILAQAPPGRRRELFVVSDFQRSNWVAADFSPLPKETAIELESVAPKQTPANLAILRVAATSRVEQGREAKVEVEVGNYSDTPRDVQAELSVAGSTYRVSGHCSPGATTVLSANILPRNGGWQAGEARLVGDRDALAADDARAFVLDVRQPLTFLLITRDSPRPHVSSSHFIERALVPVKPREVGHGEQVTRADPDSLDRDAVARADVIVIDHPGRLSTESARLLASVVRRGRGLVYVAAEPIDASNLSLIADAAGSDLKLPVQFLPPAAPREGLFIASTGRSGQGVFAAFGENLPAAIAPLRLGGGLDSRQAPGGLSDDVLATLSDRSAFLTLTSCGAGRVAIVNADLGQSNLAASPVLVPLLGELVSRLAARSGTADALPCGDVALAYLPPEITTAGGLSVVRSDGAAAQTTGELADESGSVVWRWNETGAPGVYEVRRGSATLFALATGVPAAESDLTAIDPSLLTGRLAGGRTIQFHAAGADEDAPETAWSWIVAACIGCMLLELATLKFFRT